VCVCVCVRVCVCGYARKRETRCFVRSVLFRDFRMRPFQGRVRRCDRVEAQFDLQRVHACVHHADAGICEDDAHFQRLRVVSVQAARVPRVILKHDGHQRIFAALDAIEFEKGKGRRGVSCRVFVVAGYLQRLPVLMVGTAVCVNLDAVFVHWQTPVASAVDGLVALRTPPNDIR